MNTLIKDSTKLNTYVTNTLKAYQSAGVRIHIAVISALYHAAATGQNAVINRIMAGLRSNDATAVRQFVRRVSAIVGLEGEEPDGLAAEVIQAAVEAGALLDFKQGEFTIKEGRGHTSAIAKTWAKMCEERFINPDGERDKYILDRNNFTEVKTLGDVDALKNLIRAATAVEEETDTRKLNVSKKVKDFFAKVRDQAEAMQNQYELAASPNTPKPAAKSRRRGGGSAPAGATTH